jgi:hypothetical protein
MIGEIVGLLVLLVGVAIFGAVAWRLTLHVIGVGPQEFATWRTRFREKQAPETQPEMSGAVAPASANPSGPAERFERILALLDDTAGTRGSSV